MKALMLYVDPIRFGLFQVLRPISKKLCYTGPLSALKLKEIPEPDLPSPEWVKIKTRLCGLCGSDINLMFHKDSPTAMPFTSFPCVPGHELCGEIVETGSRVDTWKKGDFIVVSPQLNCDTRGISPVCASCATGISANCENYAEGAFAPGMFTGICKDIGGGFGEYMVAHRSQLFKVPPSVSPEAATLTEPLAVALQSVMDNKPEKNDKVLIIGGGVIGALTVKVIRGLGIGCHITVAEPGEFASRYVKKCGADSVIAGSIIDAAVKITGGRAYKPMIGDRIVMGGFNRIYDTVGHQQTLHESMRSLAAGGTLSVVGIGNDAKLDLTPLWLKLQTVKGCYAYGYTREKGAKRYTFQIALDMIAKKKIAVEDMLTHTFPIEKYRSMIEVNLDKSKHGAMKTAISFG
jgi:threonine dehydrogenase-like Zn-dependent dehydrogenase